jgi:Fructose-1,6-bisphosphate aldolase
MDGSHSIDLSYDACARSFQALFDALDNNGVNIKCTILKPSMVTPGSLSEKASIIEVADMTVKCLKENIPSDLPGVTFLSGGQTELEATAHLMK